MMHWKTIAGLALLSLMGIVLAMLFQRDPQATQAEAFRRQRALTANRSGHGPRGSIVPLPSDEPHPGAAFIAGGARERSQDADPREASAGLSGVPSIRRTELSPATDSGPQMQREFPTPLAMLGIDAFPTRAAESNPQQEKIQGPVAALQESPQDSAGDSRNDRRQAVTHTIVDGDTLPSLAQKYLGDTGRAEEIYAANRNVLNSPELLPIGKKIVIPGER